jgi:hypothetical protein
MTTFEWNCLTVDTYPTAGDNVDVVYNVHWRVTGTSDQTDADGNAYTATSIGTQTLSTDDLTDFVAFADLDNATVEGWVKAEMGADAVTEIENSVDSQINEQITPTSVTKTIGA